MSAPGSVARCIWVIIVAMVRIERPRVLFRVASRLLQSLRFSCGKCGAGLALASVTLFLSLASVVGATGTSIQTGTASTQDHPVSDRVVNAAIDSVGMVRSAGVFGTGWIAGHDTVVTNLHVAKAGSGDIYFDFSDGERVECYSAVGDRDMDLAVLRCPTGDRQAMELNSSVPVPGTPVAVVGYPEGVGPTVTKGVIGPGRPVARGIVTVSFTAEIRPGSSGSPVFDGVGDVRAVATFGGGLGVPIGELIPLLRKADGYPATKAGAEWRLRIRRSLLVGVPSLLIAWFFARRYGRNDPWKVALRWMIIMVVVTLAITQILFAAHGPATFI